MFLPSARTNWISFENEESVARKVALAKQLSLGGVAVIALDRDDFDNSCAQGSWPLLSSVHAQATCSESAAPESICPAGYVMKHNVTQELFRDRLCINYATARSLEERVCELNVKQAPPDAEAEATSAAPTRRRWSSLAADSKAANYLAHHAVVIMSLTCAVFIV